ncbi:MAG: sigma-70 family RNA polymerase sigma factor [Planctomycetota bacterium]|nr:sigma-70 family RNA polymerase sigma factor [Planctomycetota bacterium]
MSGEPGRPSDEQLLLGYRETGDRDQFTELVHRYERELYSYLRRYLGDAEMAEDAFQGTFLQVHLKCDQFKEGRRFRPWLYTIATNQAIDLQRRNRRHRAVSLDGSSRSNDDDQVGALLDLLESREDSPLTRVERDEQQRWVRRTVEELPEPLRAAVALVYYQGLKYREAADVLSIPVGTVKSRLHTALLKLNQAWQRAHAEHN